METATYQENWIHGQDIDRDDRDRWVDLQRMPGEFEVSGIQSFSSTAQVLGNRQNFSRDATTGSALLSSGYYSGNYSTNSYRAKIVTPDSTMNQPTTRLIRSDVTQMTTSEADKAGCGLKSYKQPEGHDVKEWYNKSVREFQHQPMKPRLQVRTTADTTQGQAIVGYSKMTYAVEVDGSVKNFSTHLYASLPRYSKYMVKDRIKTTNGTNIVKLTLMTTDSSQQSATDVVERDGAAKTNRKTEKVHIHYHENYKKTGYIIYAGDTSFCGNFKYPLPSAKASSAKIGKGGNGYVFTMYHDMKEYAVKKTVYRANEVNLHSSLDHENILDLVAVMMGERHERHGSKFYCFHFLPKMDCDLRTVLSTKETGCLKHFYQQCTSSVWLTAFCNIKFIFIQTLKALAYLHSNGYVHRDVKASNIMLKTSCSHSVLSCTCKSKFDVKLGDFDSAGTIPGLGISEDSNQMIKFASILPLGTQGYRAPEVSMHITLSGPYEPLYTSAVDMWSFGCLVMNVCLGKTPALRQREEAALLLSKNCAQKLKPLFAGLWEKTIKIKELESTLPFNNEPKILSLVRDLLQVNYKLRLTAVQAQSYL